VVGTHWKPYDSLGAPQVLAHRGASAVEVENTLLAFRRAKAFGAHAVELDVRLCKSGEMIVHHNPVLSDGRQINLLNKDELPSHVCTLAEALDACDGMWVNIEIKNDEAEPDFDPTEKLAGKMVELLRGLGAPSQWLISSFRRETIDAVHALWPELPTAWLTTTVDDAQAESVAADLRASGHSALHPNVRTLTQHVVNTMHLHGLSVNTWTIDDPVRMAELLEWGIDGLCTNKPDVALEVIARNR
jgi:glycerophosphoryl diester phosphodiesterase